MRHFQLKKVAGVAAMCLVLAGPFAFGSGLSLLATVTTTGDDLTLEFQDATGAKFQETIPVHHAGSVKYFSAGVGTEERSAKYPAFPLKLIFVSGPKAYLSQVAVTIIDAEGRVRLEVPREQVSGPWLFVDLPPGTYDITAEGPDKARIKERVTISAKESKAVYLRWKGETS